MNTMGRESAHPLWQLSGYRNSPVPGRSDRCLIPTPCFHWKFFVRLLVHSGIVRGCQISPISSFFTVFQYRLFVPCLVHCVSRCYQNCVGPWLGLEIGHDAVRVCQYQFFNFVQIVQMALPNPQSVQNVDPLRFWSSRKTTVLNCLNISLPIFARLLSSVRSPFRHCTKLANIE